MSLKLTMTPMVREVQLNLVSINQMEIEQTMVAVRFQGAHGEAWINGPISNHIRGVFARYKDLLINGLIKKLPPSSGKQLCLTRD